MNTILLKIIEIGFLPCVVLLATNWYKVTRLTEKERSKNLYLVRLGEKIDRIERHLVKTDKFDPGTDSGFFEQ